MKIILVTFFMSVMFIMNAIGQHAFVMEDGANISKDKLIELKTLSYTFYAKTNHNIFVVTSLDPSSYKLFSESNQTFITQNFNTDNTADNGNKNTIYFVFNLNSNKTRMEFKIKAISDKLIGEVERYITNKISNQYGINEVMTDKSISLQNINTYYDIITEYVRLSTIALDPRWSQKLKTNADAMVLDERYQRGNCYDMFCEYYEFEPYELSATTFSDQNYIYGFDPKKKYLPRTLGIVDFLNTTNNFHANISLSDWPQLSVKSWTPNIPEILQYHSHILDLNVCRYKMKWEILEQGEVLPLMAWHQIHGWRATYCNLFAGDLSNKVFNQIPWDSHKPANEIFSYMPTKSHFISLSWQDAWKYINAGYIVYFVSSADGHGHIATGYPTSYLRTLNIDGQQCNVGNVAQAGVDYLTGVFYLNDKQPWELKSLSNVNIYMYLGYIK